MVWLTDKRRLALFPAKTINQLFSDGTESDTEFEGFSSEDDEGSTDDNLISSDDEIFVNQQPRNRKKQANDSSDGWDMKLWKIGDIKLQPLPKFTAEPGFNFIISDNAHELYFLNLFFTDELLESVTLETNNYPSEYLQKNKDRLKHILILKNGQKMVSVKTKWVGVQWGQSSLMQRRCLFSLPWKPF